MEKVYWKTKDGQLIDIDEMSIEHLRNTLKFIIKRRKEIRSEAYNKTAILDEYWDNFWKPE